MIYYEDYIKFENGIYETFNSSKEFDSPTIKMYSCRKNSAIISALKSCIILNITNSKFTDSSFNQMEISVSKDKTTVNITIQEKIIDKLINYMPFCTNVQCLWINQNTQTLDPFLNLPSLKYLFIYRCSVNYKINDILKIKSLKILSIERTDLLYIPEEISNLKELEVLSLMHNSIQTLPKEIEKLLNLKYLGLNGTSITQIPNTLEKLIHLQYLYLGKTKITELPIGLSHLKELLRLALWETELKELPEWICSFSKLKGLYLGRSKNIQFLPQNLGDLVNLEELYLDGTGITELPESFSNLINLRNLQLNDTKIQKIPRLNPMKHLISCNLSNMVIEKIPKEFITAKMNIYTNTNSHIGTRNGLFLYNTKLLCQPISLFSHEKKFIYEIDDNHEFLPMLCEENEPDSVQSFISNDCLEYFMEYEYLPNNVLHKLMIRMRNNLQKDKIWLTGMFLSEHEEGVSAIIRMHEKKLEIFIKSENADLISPKEYLREIRGHLSNINKELGLNAQDTLVYKEDNLREEIPYDTLLILLNERQTTYFSTTFRKKLSVKALLGIVEARVDYLQYLAENSHELSEKDLREIMLHLPQVSYFDLEQELISCCIDLQGQNLLKKQGSENDLNTYIKGLLTHCQKYIVHDQTLNGISAGGISPGELDLKICVKKNTREEPLAIVEALKLDSVNKTYIKNHIDKIYGYDTWGSKYNYLLVYAYTKNFELFCSKYKSFMQTNDFPLQVQNHLTERRLNNISEIRIFNTILIRNGRETTLTHIIVNME